jgi:hypothetical protein
MAMLNELIRITSSKPYSSCGAISMKGNSYRAWKTPNARFIFEIFPDDTENVIPQTWEVVCI